MQRLIRAWFVLMVVVASAGADAPDEPAMRVKVRPPRDIFEWLQRTGGFTLEDGSQVRAAAIQGRGILIKPMLIRCDKTGAWDLLGWAGRAEILEPKSGRIFILVNDGEGLTRDGLHFWFEERVYEVKLKAPK